MNYVNINQIVILAKAGIQELYFQWKLNLDSRLRGNDK